MTGDWKLAVRKVRAKYPKLAQLDDEFLTALEGSNRSAAAVQSSASVAAHLHVAEEFVSRLNVSAGGPAPSRIQSRPRPISHPQEGVRASGAAIAIAVGVILGIFRSMNSDHTNYQYTPPKVPSVRPIDEILRQTRDPSNFPPRWPVDGSNPDEGSSADRNAEALKIIERLVREKYHKSSPSNDDPPFLPPVPVPPQPNPEGRKTQGFRFPPQRSERPLLSPTLIGPIDSRPASPQGSPR